MSKIRRNCYLCFMLCFVTFATVQKATSTSFCSTEDKEVAKNNPNTKFAEGITQNLNFSIKDADKEFARKNPDTKFAYGLVQNPHYEVDDADRDFSRNNPDAKLTEFLTKNPTY